MRKIFGIIFILLPILLLTACANAAPIEGHPTISPPVVTITTAQDLSHPDDSPPVVEPLEETPLPEPSFFPFNEYIISLEFEPETRTITGLQSVRYTNRTGTTLEEVIFRVPLNAWNGEALIAPYTDDIASRTFRRGRQHGYMNILHVSLDSEETTFDLQGTILTMNLPRPLEPDETTQIHIQFAAQIPMISHRTGANNYAIWCGAFLPIEAVFGPNGWHTEPYYPTGIPFIMDVANYIVDITTPIGYTVAGTGTKEEIILEDRQITTFTAQMTRDFAFAISPYFQRDTFLMQSAAGVVEINLYHYTPDLSIEHILSRAAETMAFFEETVGAFPYDQLSIVETDMFRNGQKFSGIIFMDSFNLQTSPTLSSLRNEIGHQWFSVIVGSNPIEEAWLNGGLTHFLQWGLLGQPEALRAVIERDHQDLENYMYRTGYEVRRLATRLDQYNNWSDYFRIQHRKAQIMFYDLYRRMGEENFRYLLREYYGRFAFQMATAADFKALAEEILEDSLDEFFDHWLMTIELPELPTH